MTTRSILFASLAGTAAVVAAGCTSPSTSAQRLAEAERAGICPVHRQTLEAQRVPISYGLVMDTPEGLRQAEIARFPFTRRDVLGGCLVFIDEEHPEHNSPVAADILVCTACDDAKARWMRRHPSHPWTKWWQNSAQAPTVDLVASHAD